MQIYGNNYDGGKALSAIRKAFRYDRGTRESGLYHTDHVRRSLFFDNVQHFFLLKIRHPSINTIIENHLILK